MVRKLIISLIIMAGLTGYLYAGIVDGKADLVLGQANFTSRSANRGSSTPAANTLYSPMYICIDTATARLYVADRSNHRILWWNNYDSLVNGQSANGVLGQDNFNSGLYNRTNISSDCSAVTLSYPNGVTVDQYSNIWVSDSANDRVLKYNYATLTNGASASLVIGQADFSGYHSNRGGGPTAISVDSPHNIIFDRLGNLWFADYSNNRLLKYLKSDLATSAAAISVQGQLGFTGLAANDSNGDGVTDTPSAKTLYAPFGAAAYGDSVWVTDFMNNRVLRYSGAVTTNSSFMASDIVVGQNNFVSNLANRGSAVPSALTLQKPYSLLFDNFGNLWIADTYNHRVLKYNSTSITGAEIAAALVLGQGGMTTKSSNRGGSVNSNTLYYPSGVQTDIYGNIWISDYSNHRILRYNALRLTASNPNLTYKFDTATINVFGKGIPVGSTVALTMAGQPPINSVNVNVLTSTAAVCSFQLGDAAAGSWDITITSVTYFNGGSCNVFSSVLPNALSVVGFSVSGVSPQEVFSSGTVGMTLSGNAFLAGSTVRIYLGAEAVNATNINVLSSSKISFDVNIPTSATPGFWSVQVTSGAFSSELENAICVRKLWKVFSVTPSYGYETVSARISNLAGENFLVGSSLKLTKVGEEDVVATNINVESSNKITCDVDLTGRALGMWNVAITSGTLTSTTTGVFEIKTGGWSIASVTPAAAYNYGAVDITDLAGTNFPAGSIVELTKTGETGISAAGVNVLTSNKIACTLDLTLKATGFWNIVVASGPYWSRLADGFEIKGMEIHSITPSSSFFGASGDTVVIAGQGFLGGSNVLLRKAGETSILASNIVITGTEITCKLNLSGAAVGVWDVVVTSGIFGATLAGGFEIRYDVSASAVIDNTQVSTLAFRGESGDMSVEFPVGTFSSNVILTVTTTTLPGSDDETIVPTKVGVNITNDKALQPRKDFSLTMYYRDIDTMNYDATKFVIGYYDEANIRWVVLPSQVNVTSRRVVARPNHLTIFAILQLAPSTNVDNARIFPNPYNPRKHTQGMTIANLPARAELKIYTVGGDLVREVGYTTGNSRTVWDGKNDAGLEVASGVYVMLIKSPIGTTKIKFAVER